MADSEQEVALVLIVVKGRWTSCGPEVSGKVSRLRRESEPTW